MSGARPTTRSDCDAGGVVDTCSAGIRDRRHAGDGERVAHRARPPARDSLRRRRAVPRRRRRRRRLAAAQRGDLDPADVDLDLVGSAPLGAAFAADVAPWRLRPRPRARRAGRAVRADMPACGGTHRPALAEARVRPGTRAGSGRGRRLGRVRRTRPTWPAPRPGAAGSDAQAGRSGVRGRRRARQTRGGAVTGAAARSPAPPVQGFAPGGETRRLPAFIARWPAAGLGERLAPASRRGSGRAPAEIGGANTSAARPARSATTPCGRSTRGAASKPLMRPPSRGRAPAAPRSAPGSPPRSSHRPTRAMDLGSRPLGAGLDLGPEQTRPCPGSRPTRAPQSGQLEAQARLRQRVRHARALA